MFVSKFTTSLLAFASAALALPTSTSTSLAARAYSGDVTYYDTGLGACGVSSSNSEYVAAVSLSFFNSYPGATANPNLNPICGKVIRITYGSRSVDVTVRDNCPTCALYDLDITLVAMQQLVDNPVGVGRITSGISWDFVGGSGGGSTGGGSGGGSGGSCSGTTAWSASAVFTGGMTASYNGFVWTAKWWTQGEVPGTTDVWTKGAAC
ncbi:carbohydrate-binding module family 5 protein [Cylindrobasidium torrendii FP15055 ss-10]|uniref:Carbohydrate-binding module family 5 protein n=1 Tax=Cylindrobasidium torrendii FP15055 ss-10 TaxID=1314674 RepID=A0A0D7AUJ1_9AGAR|nr:carbohydrate-binding module family 5 protein [Cylindrobasidium torrendii FP15055 ss-10]